MDKPKMFEDATPEERAKLLRENCYAVEVEDVKRDFTPMELEQKRNELTDLNILKMDKEDELSAVKKPLEAAIKQAKEDIKVLSRDLKKKAYTQSEELFFFDDQDDKMMNAYDVEGNLIYSRKLKPSERQSSVVTMSNLKESNG